MENGIFGMGKHSETGPDMKIARVKGRRIKIKLFPTTMGFFLVFLGLYRENRNPALNCRTKSSAKSKQPVRETLMAL